MSRSKWKSIFFTKEIWRKSYNSFFIKKNIPKRWIFSRSSYIPIKFLYRIIKIHKGKGYSSFFVDNYNLGYKFGEFSFTKKIFHFPLKKKKK